MAITVTFDPPLPSDDPATFNTKAFTLLGDLNDWSTEANSLASTVNSNASSAASSASGASTSAGAAATSASNASTSASNASSSASAASSSASSASSSASAASTSASNASTSASAAAASAASINPSLLPSMRPSLLLDFANSRAMDGRITFTRASSATRTNTNGLIETVASGVPRIDFDPITLACKGLLVEESRANLIFPSADFRTVAEGNSYGAWQESGSGQSIAFNVTGPDGVTNSAQTITWVDTTGTRFCEAAVSANSTVTASVYLKQGSSSYTSLQCYFRAGTTSKDAYAVVNWSNNTVAAAGADSANASVSLQVLSGGWVRVTCTHIDTGSNTICQVSVAPTTSDGFTGAGGTVIAYGIDAQVGAFPTSYIPTTSAQVTRAADLATITGANFLSWYRPDEGTFLASYDQIADVPSGYQRSWCVSDGTNNNYIQNHVDAASNTNVFELRVSGVTLNVPTAFTSYTGSATTTALAYKVSNTGFAKDGGAANQNLTTAAIPTVTTLSIGTNATATAATFLSGHIARIAYYPKRLTNTELQALTA